MGDGLLVAFASARRGVTCATDIQKALEAHNRRQPDRQLGVRIGLHAGDAIEEGGDLFGAAVSAAVRIADKAKGGEIVVSETVKQLPARSRGSRSGIGAATG